MRDLRKWFGYLALVLIGACGDDAMDSITDPGSAEAQNNGLIMRVIDVPTGSTDPFTGRISLPELGGDTLPLVMVFRTAPGDDEENWHPTRTDFALFPESQEIGLGAGPDRKIFVISQQASTN